MEDIGKLNVVAADELPSKPLVHIERTANPELQEKIKVTKDLTGMVIGSLTVVKEILPEPGKWASRWLCKCSCGEEIIYTRGAMSATNYPRRYCGKPANHTLITAHPESIGKKVPPKLNLVGDVYGDLTVIRENGRDKHSNKLWLCQCSCGNTVTLRGASLRSANTPWTNCGDIDKHPDMQRARGNINEQMIGRRYVKLVVQEFMGTNKHNQKMFRCLCDCGNEKVVSRSHLISKSAPVTSCGCDHVTSRKAQREEGYVASVKMGGKFIYLGVYQTQGEADAVKLAAYEVASKAVFEAYPDAQNWYMRFKGGKRKSEQ